MFSSDPIRPAAPQDPGSEGSEPDDSVTGRVPASEVPSIEGLHISPPGTQATLLNISQAGLLAECGTVIRPGTKVTITFSGRFKPSSIKGRVARCVVSRMSPEGIRYEMGIGFDDTLALPVPSSPASVRPDHPFSAAPQPALPSSDPPPLRNRW